VPLHKRKLHLELGFSTLFDYCRRELGYSEGSAWRRINAARCLADSPEIAELFLCGKVTLCSVATAAKYLKAKETKVEELVGKSKREVELLLAPLSPSKPKESIKAVVLEPKAAPLSARCISGT